jgi:hypothetical protein
MEVGLFRVQLLLDSQSGYAQIVGAGRELRARCFAGGFHPRKGGIHPV